MIEIVEVPLGDHARGRPVEPAPGYEAGDMPEHVATMASSGQAAARLPVLRVTPLLWDADGMRASIRRPRTPTGRRYVPLGVPDAVHHVTRIDPVLAPL